MTRRSPLDDPRNAAHAWRRYRRLMLWMGVFTLAVVVVALALLHNLPGSVPIHFYIAVALGIGAAMMLMSALMGLVFMSSGTGHDEALADRPDDEEEL